MIAMSQWRLRLVFAVLAVCQVSFSGCVHGCTLIGCLEGLSVSLTGGFDPDKTYTIELGRLTATGTVPVMSCSRTWPSSSGPEMQCTSSLPFEADPARIRILDQHITELRVVISTGGAVVGQKDFGVAFATREINGKGCGWCTSASIDVDFPVRPVWGAQGHSLTAGFCGNDAVGATSFTATEDQLSVEQLRVLSQMVAVPEPAPSCPEGQMDCFMQVAYRDNSVADWYARPSDGTCFDIPDRPEKLVSYATFEPFRQTLGCRYSRELTTVAIEAASGTGPIPVLAPSSICRHGILTNAQTTTSIGLDVPAGAVHHIGLHQCNLVADDGRIELQLFDPAGSTLLTRGTNPQDATNDTCQVIDFSFPGPGQYVLKMIVPASYLAGTAFLSYE